MTAARGFVVALAALLLGVSMAGVLGVSAEGAGTEWLNDRGGFPGPHATNCDPAPPPAVSVPGNFTDLYTLLDGQIDAFDATVAAGWDGSHHPVAFSAEVQSATTHRGPELLDPAKYVGIQLELDRLAAMGLRAVTASISFPIFDPNFHPNASDRQAYIDVFKQFADDVRARGLMLIVDSTVMFPEYTSLPVQSYYDNLTYEQYRLGRLHTLQTIATELAPDFLSMGSEPDTEELITGQPVSGALASGFHIGWLAANLRFNGTTLPLGAGVGTWMPGYDIYAAIYASIANLTYLDVHVYPLNFDFMDRILAIADIAAANGKGIAIGEFWPYKSRDAELSLGVTYNDIYARDAYDFWVPIDQKAIRALVNATHYKQFEFFSPFWEKYLFAYLDYNDVEGLDWQTVFLLSNVAAVGAMLNGTVSGTGHAYMVAIDETPPTAPGNLTGTAASPTEVDLSWTDASDNVEVWCYRVFRDGVEVSDLKGTTHAETGLTQTTTYGFEVIAYDEAGNASPPASVSVTTPAPNDAPTALFSFSPATPTTAGAVAFTDLSTDTDGTIVSWAWTFGDGATSTARNPSHTYASPGVFNVALTVADDGGLTDSWTQQVPVAVPPDATDPTIAIATPADGARLASRGVTVTGTASDDVALATVEVSLDGETWTLASGTTDWSLDLTLAEGTNTIYARATDTSGNAATTSVQVAVDLPPDLGLILGLAALLGIVGVVAVVILLRRRRTEGPAPPPPGGEGPG